MNKNLRLTALLVSTTTLSMAFTPAAGQDDTPGGLTLTYGISSTLRFNDNIGLDDPSLGDSYLWDNELSFGLLKETQTDTLELDLSGILRLSDTPGEDGFDFDDQRVRLGYDREGANSRLSFGARYRQADLAFTDPVRLILDDVNNDGTIDDQDFLIDDGTLRTTNLNFEFETGTSSPFGAGIELNYNLRRYSDTIDPGLFDEDLFRAEVFGRFTLSPLAEGRVVLGYEDYKEDDITQEKRETYDVRVEVDYEINPVTTLTAMLGYRDIEETTNVPTVITQTGVIAALGLTRELPNGSAGVELETDLIITGRRDTLIVNRDLELPTGALAVAVGVSHTDGSGDFDVVGSLAYIHDLPRGNITATLERDSVTDEDGDDRVTTLVGIDFLNQINASSSLLFELDYVMNDESLGGGLGERETNAATFRTTYIKEISRDWNLRTGYEYRSLNQTGSGFRDSNEVFITLETQFTVRR